MRASSDDQPGFPPRNRGDRRRTALYVASLREVCTSARRCKGCFIRGGEILYYDLAIHFRSANAFVTASEHEGFCVPVLEAMAFGLPVIVYAAGAIPETVGSAGVLMSTLDPLVWAAVVDRVVSDARLRSTLVTAGTRRLRDFAEPVFTARLSRALKSVGLAS